MPDKPHDVVIVGFGPVGQLLALLLGRQGYDVLVLERWLQPYDKPRAVHFDHEIGRVFQAAGVANDVMAVTDPVPDFYEWRNAGGDPLLRIDWSGTGPSGWPTANFFSQPDLERVLSQRVEALPNVEVLRGHEVVDLAQDENGVRLVVTGSVVEHRRFHPRYSPRGSDHEFAGCRNKERCP